MENRHKTIEYSQLLNHVKSGLIMLTDMTNKRTIKFANLLATRVFRQLPMQGDELTEQDMDRKIFEKVTFKEEPQGEQENAKLSLNEIKSSMEENRNLFTIYKVSNPVFQS